MKTALASALPLAGATLFLAALSFEAHATPDCWYDQWNHNGSRMEVEGCQSTFTILYDRPRNALRRQGVRSGTVLVRARSMNGGRRVTGTAYVFRAGCAPAPYRVSGRFVGRGLRLAGQAPVRGADCRVRRTRPDTLRFD